MDSKILTKCRFHGFLRPEIAAPAFALGFGGLAMTSFGVFVL
jgi:hypothetical protein